MQSVDKLIYGVNIKSITTDNGSEFYDWKRFKRSIYSAKEDIDVYFCHSYASWEKGGVENFNGLIRKDYSKDFDFSTISQDEIDNEIKKINEIYRETLGYHSAKERYNELSLINWIVFIKRRRVHDNNHMKSLNTRYTNIFHYRYLHKNLLVLYNLFCENLEK